MCNGIFWIVLAWLFLGNNGTDLGGNACGGCGQTNTCGCGQTTPTYGCGCYRETACGQATEVQTDCCDRVRVVRDCGC